MDIDCSKCIHNETDICGKCSASFGDNVCICHIRPCSFCENLKFEEKPKDYQFVEYIGKVEGTFALKFSEQSIWLITRPDRSLYGEWAMGYLSFKHKPIETTEELILLYNQSIDFSTERNKPQKIILTLEEKQKTETTIQKGNQSMLFQVAITMSPIQRAGQGYEDGKVLVEPTSIEAPSKEVAIAKVAQGITTPLTELDRLKIICKPFAD